MRTSLAIAAALLSHHGTAAPEPQSSLQPLLPSLTGPLGPVVTAIANIGNAEPPPLIYTPHRSPECEKSKGGNGGALQCCRTTVAGDIQLVEFLAKLYGYNLTPNDINGVLCDDEIKGCPGVLVCCEVTALMQLGDVRSNLRLYRYNGTPWSDNSILFAVMK
ncbi:hypothetical protein GGS21DRAFT_322941 [Xylaria nigripes]|nr:hypothetical protein GGS21DRAFT_322941 [Xylaria nigripes]